jgi:hypothetical protein
MVNLSCLIILYRLSFQDLQTLFQHGPVCGPSFAFLSYRLVIAGKVNESTLVVQGCSGSLTTQSPPSRRRSIFGVFPAVSPLATQANLVLREPEFFFGTVEFFSSTADPLSSQPNPIRWGDLVFHFRGHPIGRDRKLSLDDSAARRRDIYGYDLHVISVARGMGIQRAISMTWKPAGGASMGTISMAWRTAFVAYLRVNLQNGASSMSFCLLMVRDRVHCVATASPNL